MLEPKESQLVEELSKATDAGKIQWSPTAEKDEFTASFGGKLSVVVAERDPLKQFRNSRSALPPLPTRYELTVLDANGRIVHQFEDSRIGSLLNLVRRYALHGDKAMDEILEELHSR